MEGSKEGATREMPWRVDRLYTLLSFNDQSAKLNADTETLELNMITPTLGKKRPNVV